MVYTYVRIGGRSENGRRTFFELPHDAVGLEGRQLLLQRARRRRQPHPTLHINCTHNRPINYAQDHCPPVIERPTGVNSPRPYTTHMCGYTDGMPPTANLRLSSSRQSVFASPYPVVLTCCPRSPSYPTPHQRPCASCCSGVGRAHPLFTLDTWRGANAWKASLGMVLCRRAPSAEPTPRSTSATEGHEMDDDRPWTCIVTLICFTAASPATRGRGSAPRAKIFVVLQVASTMIFLDPCPVCCNR